MNKRLPFIRNPVFFSEKNSTYLQFVSESLLVAVCKTLSGCDWASLHTLQLKFTPVLFLFFSFSVCICFVLSSRWFAAHERKPHQRLLAAQGLIEGRQRFREMPARRRNSPAEQDGSRAAAWLEPRLLSLRRENGTAEWGWWASDVLACFRVQVWKMWLDFWFSNW